MQWWNETKYIYSSIVLQYRYEVSIYILCYSCFQREKGVFLIFLYGGSSRSTPQGFHWGQENPAGAPGRSGPGSAEGRCYQRQGAVPADGRRRAGSDPAHGWKVPESGAGHLPGADRADQGHWPVKTNCPPKKCKCATVPPPSCIWWLAGRRTTAWKVFQCPNIDIYYLCPKAQLKLETQLQCPFHFVCVCVCVWWVFNFDRFTVGVLNYFDLANRNQHIWELLQWSWWAIEQVYSEPVTVTSVTANSRHRLFYMFYSSKQKV